MGASEATVQTFADAANQCVGAKDIIITNGYIGSASALETTLELDGTFKPTLNAGGTDMVVGTNDKFIVLYDVASNTYLAVVNSTVCIVKGGNAVTRRPYRHEPDYLFWCP